MGMTKARVLPLPVTWKGRELRCAFPPSSFWRANGRTGCTDIAYSPLLQRRLCFSWTEGWLRTEKRDGKLPVMGCHDTTDKARSPRNTALALVTLDPTAEWTLISHHQGPQCGQVTRNTMWCLCRWCAGEASWAGSWESWVLALPRLLFLSRPGRGWRQWFFKVPSGPRSSK